MRIKVYVVSYIDEGRTVEIAFREIADAHKLKKIKRGNIKSLDVIINPSIKF